MSPLLPLLSRSAYLQRTIQAKGRAIHKGGAEAGLRQTDRSRPGSKRHLAVDAGGTRLAVSPSHHLAAPVICAKFVERWFC
jgi:hypothetical protein